MSSVWDDPDLFKKNPLYHKHEPSNYTPFYVTLLICTILFLVLIVFNIFFCCFSKHRHYWKDSNTGNRWLLPIWVKSPAAQLPLDLSELKLGAVYTPPVYEAEFSDDIALETAKQRESEI